MRQIVGICLVKNEEYFIAWALLNAVEFCDKILVMDNQSEDRTPHIVKQIASQYSHVELISVKDGNNTHKYVEKYAGTSTWILRIDGDEIFDPVGLAKLRPRLLSGEFDEFWRIEASTLHVAGIFFDQSQAFGYAPPSVAVLSNLYNFNAIESWFPGRRERLHGVSSIAFRSGYSLNSVKAFWVEHNWSDSQFRGLHVCFLPRSSLDEDINIYNQLESRKNIAEYRLARRLARKINKNYAKRPDHKNRTYVKDELVSLEISNFRQPDEFFEVDSECNKVMQIIENTTNHRKEFLNSKSIVRKLGK